MAIDYSIVSALMPECILVLAAVFIFLGGAWFPGRMAWTLVALTACAMGGLMLSRAPESTMAGVDFASQQVANATAADVTNEMNLAGQLASASRIANDSAWVSDRLGQGLRGCALLFGVLFVIFATQSRQYHLYSEIVGCILLITAGLMLVSGAADLVLMFVGLELISIPTYVLLFVGRSGRASDEATAKYFYLSLLASAILLYGFATLYGLAGDTRFAAIQASLNESVSGPFKTLFPVAFLMILCGFSFKLASVPFHFYAPDVYQATTSFNAALLAVVPKIAGVIGVVRILVIGIPHESTAIWQIVVILAIVTMTLANAAALWQTDMRRLMAYSSIAHAGYLLIGLAAALAAKDSLGWGPSAVSAMVFYVMAYAAATIGTFAALAYLSDDDERFSTLTQLKGIGRAHPLIGGFIAICMFSLAGIPPLAGFLGKFALFRSALDAALPASGGTNGWFLTLCILGVLNAAVAAAYYLRVVAVLYFDSSGEPREELEVFGNHGAGLASMLSVLIVLAVGLFAGRAMTGAQAAAAAAWPHRTPELRGPRLGALIGEESAIRETSTLRNAVSGDRTSSHSVSSRMAKP